MRIDSETFVQSIYPSIANGPDIGSAALYWGNVYTGGLWCKYPSGNNAINLLDGAKLNFSTADTKANIYRWSVPDFICTDGSFVALENLVMMSSTGVFSARTPGDACFLVSPSIATITFNGNTSTTLIGNYIRPEAAGTLSIGTGGRDVAGSFSDCSYIHTSGYLPMIKASNSFTPGSGTGSNAALELNPTVNGISSGKFAALAIASVTNTLTGGSVNLIEAGTTTTDYGTGFTSKFKVDSSGNTTIAGNTFLSGTLAVTEIDIGTGAYIERLDHSGHHEIMVRGNADPGAGKGSVYIGATTALAETEFLLALVNSASSGSSKVAAIRPSGKMAISGTDSTGTPGDAVINKPMGISSIANGATACIVTNSLVSTSSLVFITWLGNLGAQSSPPYVTLGAGSFTVTVASDPGTNVPFCWEVKEIL